jgi:hypothetical protein
MQAVDPLHDPLRPLNARLNDPVGNRRTVRHSEKVICSLHVQPVVRNRNNALAMERIVLRARFFASECESKLTDGHLWRLIFLRKFERRFEDSWLP